MKSKIIISLIVILVLITGFSYWARKNHELLFQAVAKSPALTLDSGNSPVAPSTSKIVSALPANIQPEATPSIKDVFVGNKDAMKPWVLWLLYMIIPAVLAGVAIYISIRKNRFLSK